MEGHHMATDTDLPPTSVSDCVYDYTCQPCSEDGLNYEARGFCVDCSELLCQRCYDCHTVPRAMRKHKLLDMTQMVGQLNTVSREDKCTFNCIKHEENKIKYHCITHSYLGCSECIIADHRLCGQVVCISDISTEITDSEKYKEFNKTLKKFESDLKDIQNKVQGKETLVNKNHSEIVTTIKAFSQSRIDGIKIKANETIHKANLMREEKQKSLEKITDQLKLASKGLKDNNEKRKHIEKDRRFCNLYVEIVKQESKMVALNQTLEAALDNISHIELLSYKTNTELSVMLAKENCLGTFIRASPEIKEVARIGNIHTRTQSDKGTCNYTGSLFIPDNTLLLLDYNNQKIKQVDTATNKITSLSLRPGKPWDLTRISDNEVAVTLPEQQKIIYVRIKPELTVHKQIKLNGKCHGIVCCGSTLIVTYLKPSKIETLDLKGGILRSLKGENYNSLLTDVPCHLSLNPDDSLIYASSFMSNSVVCMTFQGILVATFRDSQLKGPWQIVFDSKGNGYICGQKSNNIHHMNRTLQRNQVLLCSNEAFSLTAPQAISFDESNSVLYVGFYNWEYIMKFKVN